MFVDYTDHQKELRKEFRAYFSNLIKPEHREELRNAESGDVYKSSHPTARLRRNASRRLARAIRRSRSDRK